MKRIKDEGYVEYIFCLFAILIACICVVIGIRLKAYNIAKENIENEITDSTLASAIVDMKRFQFTGLITNYDINSLYNKYTTCLQKNLNLKNPIRTDGIITKFEGPNNSLALSNDNDAIKITDYYIYNAELDKKEYYVTKLIENGEVNVNPQPELIASGVEISKVYITMKDNSKKKVFMCDNALSIYAKVNFKIKPFKFTVWKTDYSTKEEIGTLEYLVDSIGKGEHHNYESEIFKEPNCTGNGIIKYKCKDCGYVYYEGIPKLGHSIHTEKEEPTCIEEGCIKEICLRCKKILKVDKIEKLGHEMKFVEKEEIDEEIIETYKCKRCTYEEERVSYNLASTSFNFSEIVNSWKTIGAPTWTATNSGQIYSYVPGGGDWSSNNRYVHWKPGQTTSCWGTGLINPNAFATEKLTVNFTLDSGGNLNEGFCFNVTENEDGSLNGYFISLCNHSNNTRALFRFDHYCLDQSFSSGINRYMWCYNRYWTTVGSVFKDGDDSFTLLSTWTDNALNINYSISSDGKGNIVIKEGNTIVSSIFDDTYTKGTYGFWGNNCEVSNYMYISNFSVQASSPRPNGLYDNEGNQIYDWQELLTQRYITVNNKIVKATELGKEKLKGKLIIPVRVKGIAENGFKDCIKLTDIEIQKNILNIGSNAFLNCQHITYNGSLIGQPWGAKSFN